MGSATTVVAAATECAICEIRRSLNALQPGLAVRLLVRHVQRVCEVETITDDDPVTCLEPFGLDAKLLELLELNGARTVGLARVAVDSGDMLRWANASERTRAAVRMALALADCLSPQRSKQHDAETQTDSRGRGADRSGCDHSHGEAPPRAKNRSGAVGFRAGSDDPN
jgi:hypothetical protein